MADLNFKQLFREQLDNLLQRLHSKTQDQDLSMDVVQDAFVRMMDLQRRSGGDMDIRNSAAYLHGTANNVLSDYYRHQTAIKTELFANDQMNDLCESVPSAEDVVMHQQRLQHVRAAVMGLPVRSRQVFQLCRLQDKTYAEAAAHLNISVSAVQKHLALALNYMTDHLAGDE